MTNRRGMALLAALWFVVAIATVGLALSLEAREQRALGWTAAEHRATQAAVAAGIAIARARLERVQRQVPNIRGPAGESPMRAADPLLDADAYLPPIFSVGNYRVRLHAEDVGSKLNINAAAVDQLRTFLAFMLKDFTKADALAQAIDDWRDRDDLPQPRGGERRDYLARHRLDLPSNRGGFRDLEELRAVNGMTPEIFERIRPYLRVQGSPNINLNTAPLPVLHSFPRITDAIIAQILAIRSQRQRITSAEPLGFTTPGAPLSFVVEELELTVTVIPPSSAPVVREVWTLVRGNYPSINVQWADGAN